MKKNIIKVEVVISLEKNLKSRKSGPKRAIKFGVAEYQLKSCSAELIEHLHKKCWQNMRV